jgi:hypothetical protein
VDVFQRVGNRPKPDPIIQKRKNKMKKEILIRTMKELKVFRDKTEKAEDALAIIFEDVPMLTHGYDLVELLIDNLAAIFTIDEKKIKTLIEWFSWFVWENEFGKNNLEVVIQENGIETKYIVNDIEVFWEVIKSNFD